jgi:hypothetical protein
LTAICAIPPMEFGSELLGEEVPSVSTPRKRVLIY